MAIIASRGDEMKKRVVDFMKENGFLIFLFVCVCIVAVSTIMMVTKDPNLAKKNQELDLEDEVDKDLEEVSKSDDEELDKLKEEEVEDELEKEKEDQEDQEKNQPGEEEKQEQQGKEEPEKEEEQKKQEEQEENQVGKAAEEEIKKEESQPQSFIMPLDGKIITDFASDRLIYSKTLDEWRGHTGIDIKGKAGTKVKAAASGTIKEAYEDPLWGKTVVIDHGKGTITRYANLGSLDLVKLGGSVNQGDEIGVIGKTASIESKMEEHLHYELIKDGKYLDPRSNK